MCSIISSMAIESFNRSDIHQTIAGGLNQTDLKEKTLNLYFRKNA